jgi:putative DNA primase/helicase
VDLRFDAFKREVQWLDVNGERWLPMTDNHVVGWLDMYHAAHGKRPTSAVMYDSAVHVAHENRTDSLMDYLLELPEWDGVPRMETWLIKHGGAPDNAYVRSVSYKFLLSMFQRAYNAPVKVDTVLILHGRQGIGKSTVLSDLGGRYFSDKGIDINRPAEAGLAVRGVWLLEFGELDSMRRSEHTRLKQFLSHTEDSFRAPYGRSFESHPRRVVFCGTSNRDDFLSDDTGNRRYWPVPFGEYVDRPGFLESRAQLLAEARQRVLFTGDQEPWWLDKGAEVEADGLRSEVVATDPWDDLVGDWLARPNRQASISLAEVLGSACGLKPEHFDKTSELRVASILRRLGWRSRKMSWHGRIGKRWELMSGQQDIPLSTPSRSDTLSLCASKGFNVQEDSAAKTGEDSVQQHQGDDRRPN